MCGKRRQSNQPLLLHEETLSIYIYMYIYIICICCFVPRHRWLCSGCCLGTHSPSIVARGKCSNIPIKHSKAQHGTEMKRTEPEPNRNNPLTREHLQESIGAPSVCAPPSATHSFVDGTSNLAPPMDLFRLRFCFFLGSLYGMRLYYCIACRFVSFPFVSFGLHVVAREEESVAEPAAARFQKSSVGRQVGCSFEEPNAMTGLYSTGLDCTRLDCTVLDSTVLYSTVLD